MQTVPERDIAAHSGEPVHAASPSLTVHDVLARDDVRSLFQPIVDIATGAVVGHETLSRGPAGSELESPVKLFSAAREAGVLAELDEACGRAAFRTASRLGLVDPTTVFVNVEPEVLDPAPLARLRAIADRAPGELRIVLEITERALASRPAELMRTVDRVRELGWGVALDDVGVDPASLSFMAMLHPDIVKLDLSLVQDRAPAGSAAVMHAVNAYAESSGAHVLAEGIETEQHLATARGLGATLAQGWLFGRPTATPVSTPASHRLSLAGAGTSRTGRSPFSMLPDGAPVRRADKRYLIEVSKQLEQEALRLGPTCVVASSFQAAHNFTPGTAERYRAIAEQVGFVCVFGDGLDDAHMPIAIPGMRGAHLDGDDPLRQEWDVVVLSPHFSAALLARDLEGGSPTDLDREFEHAITYDRDTVILAARSMLARVDAEGDLEPSFQVVPQPPREAESRGLAVHSMAPLF